jgi:DNA polymerase I-like protein with 3'-5' exonuclease and polymerase domains
VAFGKYTVIDSPEMIKKVDDYLMNPDGSPKFPFMTFDTETNGLPLYTTVVVGFSFSVNRYSGFYFPLLVWVPDLSTQKKRTKDKVEYQVYKEGHLKCFWTGKIYPENVKPGEYELPDFVPELMQRWFSRVNLGMWNAPFDINHTFINFGVDLKTQLAVDGGLLVHIANENESVGLKESAVLYKDELGINPYVMADAEKRELKGSVIRNGGEGKEVWRADLEPQSKYAIADTFLTFGLIEVVLAKLAKEHAEQYGRIEGWIFDQEVMPVCKEVVIDMKRRGVYLDVVHFTKLFNQNQKKLIELEDQWIQAITPMLEGFEKGKSLDEAISNGRLVRRIIEMEGLKIPTQFDKKTQTTKESLAKGVVKKEYERNPHWIWGYLLGEDEIKYSQDKVVAIKQQLYEEVEGRRYRFNIGSNDHLIWLFFDKLKENRREFPKTEGSTTEDWRPSLDADNIKEKLLPKYDWVNILLKYKRIQKIQSTYVAPALELNLNGWLYMDMKQNGTTSGRFSCSGGYNLQTLPRVDDELEALDECNKCGAKLKDKAGNLTGDIELEEYIECMANRKCHKCGHIEYDIVRPSAIKKGFIAPPGYKIINADYASLEPRCFAYMSGEDNIKAVYKENLDLYSKVYCDIFDKEHQYSAHPDHPNFLKKVNKKARTFIKPLVLGIPYGAGDAQVANMTENFIEYIDDAGVKRQRPNFDEGRRIRNLYLDTYPMLRGYMSHQEYMAVEYGFVDAKYGRRRHFMWAKIIGDFFHNLPCHNNMTMDKMDKIRFFLGTGKARLQGCNATIRDYKSGNIVFMLNEENLEKLAGNLGMNFTTDKFGKDGIKQKGGWGYIRNLLKEDLNNAKNHPIQALAGAITNQGMLTVQRLFKSENLDAWVALQVHDEVTCYARAEVAERAKFLLQKGMEENIYTIPLAAEVKMVAEPVICDNLKESK